VIVGSGSVGSGVDDTLGLGLGLVPGAIVGLLVGEEVGPVVGVADETGVGEGDGVLDTSTKVVTIEIFGVVAVITLDPLPGVKLI
jgi:hypothetical protein